MHDKNKKLIPRQILGFSLLEMSIVILIISLIAASGAVVGKSAMESTQNASTNNRLNTIETALLAFRINGNRLPCPANGSLLVGDVSWGKEAANVGDCTGGIPAANFSNVVSGSKIVEGVVPVRTLGLPDEFMYDGWGRKLTYAVWSAMTDSRAFINYGLNFDCGLLGVTDGGGALRSGQADYVLLSEGANGHGAWTVQGTRYVSGSTNPFEQINCHCDATGADTGFSGNYVMKDATADPTSLLNVFDDLLRYKERWQLQSYSDQNNPTGGYTCPQALPGFRSDGTNVNDAVGSSVAVGDINGDGIPDLIIGAPGYNSNTGTVYVVFGTKRGFPDPLPLASLNGTNGFRIDGVAAGDYTGWSVASGDVNGDGIGDVIIGAKGARSNKGSIFVVIGIRQTPWPSTLALSTLVGSNGFRADGVVANGHVGWSVAAGDVNGDGYADVVIGAPHGNANTGNVYTVFGAASYSGALYTLDATVGSGLIDSLATKGFQVNPLGTDDMLGIAVSTGDTNGDGYNDEVIGHSGYLSNIGIISTIMGKGRGTWSTPVSAINLNGWNGWHAFGITGGDKFASSVAVGDVNGDGIGDIIIGAPGASPGGRSQAGSTYVLLGHNSYKLRQFYMTNINSYNGYRIDGATTNDKSGTSVAIGDINNDGIGDIVIGAPGATPSGRSQAGITYVLFGAITTPGISFQLSTINGVNGFSLVGAAGGDALGSSVATGDLNGDGKSDVITGAPGSDASTFSNSGSVYTYFGQRRPGTWLNPYDLNLL